MLDKLNDLDLSLNDYFAIEAMKILLINEGCLQNFGIKPDIATFNTSLEYRRANAKMLAEACYRIAKEMRKARLGAFE